MTTATAGDVKVVILCGGLGTRLREETEYRPKPLVPIGERPILWHIMKIYSSFGYRRFVLAVANKVAAAHREGGRLVSPAEEQALLDITTALDMGDSG